MYQVLAERYLGYTVVDDEVYQATRRTILRALNLHLYQGKYASGLGKVLIPSIAISGNALSIQGFTTREKAEKKFLLDQRRLCDGVVQVMCTSFHM